MSRPTTLLLRVDPLLYARTVYVFKKSKRRLYWWDGAAGATWSHYTTVDNVNPAVVRYLKVKEVV